MKRDGGLHMNALSEADLAALRLSCQVLAHKAAVAALPRVEMFFETIGADVEAETAARGQRGQAGESVADPWRIVQLTPVDRAAIRAYLELLSSNERLSPAVREFVRDLRRAERLS